MKRFSSVQRFDDCGGSSAMSGGSIVIGGVAIEFEVAMEDEVNLEVRKICQDLLR